MLRSPVKGSIHLTAWKSWNT